MAKMDVYIYMKRGYGDFSDFVRRKNKAKQTQYADLRPEIRSTKL